MKVELIPIEKIKPYPKNNRIHPEIQVERIAESIKRWGFNQPIIIDEKNEILVGHGRLLAAQKLNLKEVPCVKLEKLRAAEKRAYRILDNKLQNDSEWQIDNLKIELTELALDGFDLTFGGLEELSHLFPEEEPEFEEDEFDGEEPNTTFIKLGDIIELGKHRVMCGDSTKDWEELAAGQKLDMVLTDPPYGVSYVGKTKDALTVENDSLDEESLATFWNSVLDCLVPRVKLGGSVYVSTASGPIKQVFVSALKDREILRQELIWLKDSMVLGHSDYHYKHEPILYGWIPGAGHYFTPDRSKTSILEHDRPKRSEEHPTMKPISLWAELISNSSRAGNIIADPFLGSGTTLIAADQLNRICYGMEISPKYCHVIVQRYLKHCRKSQKQFECKINGEKMLAKHFES